VIRRGDGRPGDLLVCTGPHGLSRLGLALLQGEFPEEPAASAPLSPGAKAATAASREQAIAAHRRPRPRFDAVRALIACRPPTAPWRVGGCDSSDGLAAAAAAIATSSGCGARLVRTALPLDPAMASLPQAEAWCLGGGEDFELVLALEPAWAEALIAALPGTTRIGELVAGDAGALGWTDGAPWSPGDGGSAASSGYSHFS
jgi:thiamine-monophosphate kinase